MRTFFALPEADKLLIDKRTSRHFRGWEPVGAESTNNRPDIREQIDLWTEWPARDPDVEPPYLRLLGPNQWLPDEVLPGHRELVLAWFRELRALADRLLRLLSEGLGLAPDHLSDYFGDEPMSLTKLISYPPTPLGGAGVNAHHDTGFLTVLAAGTTPGPPGGEHRRRLDRRAGRARLVRDQPRRDHAGDHRQLLRRHTAPRDHRRAAPVGRLLPRPVARHPPRSRSRSTHDFAEAVAASPRHRDAGFMAARDETEAGVGDMRSPNRPDTYGEQLWNYFARSYPDNMARHYPVT